MEIKREKEGGYFTVFVVPTTFRVVWDERGRYVCETITYQGEPVPRQLTNEQIEQAKQEE